MSTIDIWSSFIYFETERGIYMKTYIKSFLVGCVITGLFWMILSPNKNDVTSFLNFLNQKNANQKILMIGRAHDSLGLDPATETDHQSIRVAANIYDTLVMHSSDGTNILPSLATKWSADESGQSWTFDIREGVSFHDGSTLDAHAIKFNFERWMDQDNPYHAGNFNYWAINFNGFPGIVEQVNVLSDYKLEIVLNRPFAPFLSALTQPAFAIASPDAIRTFNDRLDMHPVGTGPFIFSEWENQTITLRKNDNYWGQVPYVDGVIYKTIADSSERLQELEAGRLHIADLDDLKHMNKNLNESNIKVITRPSFNIGYLSLNMNNPFLKHKDVRKAIAHSLNRDLMLKNAYNENSKNANSFIPPVLWGHNESILAPDYNLAIAHSLIESYTQDQITFDLLVMNTPKTYFPDPVTLGYFIKDSIEELGIRVNIRIEPWKDVIELRDNGDYDMMISGWQGDIIDPDNFLFTLFSSNNLESALSLNYSNYSNPTVDKLLIQARQILDQDFRNSLYREIQEIIQEDMPAIPLAHTTPIIITQGIINYQPSLSGNDALNYIDMEITIE